MDILSCPAYVRIKNYEFYHDKIYNKDSLRQELLNAVRIIDEKNYPFDDDVISSILYLIAILWPGYMIYGEITSYTSGMTHNNGTPITLSEVLITSALLSVFVIGGSYYLIMWIARLVSTLKIRSGNYDIMILNVTDKDIKVDTSTDDNGRHKSIYYTFYLYFDKIKIKCNYAMYSYVGVGSKCALLISGKHVIGVSCL